ncbi:hypothetical protein FB451DRAFT_396976 [Mycena latifolia]|nr:hypothetical protein FB451DRAFT_396976 [Mycena latifolia]
MEGYTSPIVSTSFSSFPVFPLPTSCFFSSSHLSLSLSRLLTRSLTLLPLSPAILPTTALRPAPPPPPPPPLNPRRNPPNPTSPPLRPPPSKTVAPPIRARPRLCISTAPPPRTAPARARACRRRLVGARKRRAPLCVPARTRRAAGGKEG